jgi:hypothetical protein
LIKPILGLTNYGINLLGRLKFITHFFIWNEIYCRELIRILFK